MNDPEKASQHINRSLAADGGGDEPSLLLLALLEQLRIDRAHGRHYELSDYYAASPELEDEFLAMAVAALRDSEKVGSGSQEPEGGTSGRRPLSPGVLRALARIPELPPDVAEAGEHRVAESRAPYGADEEH
jgi:hypothetical protein